MAKKKVKTLNYEQHRHGSLLNRKASCKGRKGASGRLSKTQTVKTSSAIPLTARPSLENLSLHRCQISALFSGRRNRRNGRKPTSRCWTVSIRTRCSGSCPTFSKTLGLRESVFIEKYLTLDNEGDYVAKTVPCPFLGADNYCSIYEDRPSDCARFPYTDEDVLIKRKELSLKNSTFCPIVYYVF